MLSLYLPMWSVDLIRRRLSRRRHGANPREGPGPIVDGHFSPPILLVTTHANQQLVAHCCERAAAAGVRPGMTLAHARALLPANTRVYHPSDPGRDDAALRALAQWAVRFSPTVAPDLPDGLLLDVTGCQRLFRGERRLVNQLADAVARLGLCARAASAPTIGCAWAVARFGQGERSIIAPDQVRDVLRPLLTAALRIDQDTQADLAEVGIEHIGDLFDIPRAALPSRFGSDLLMRLDQATGQAIETITPWRFTAPPCAQRLFAGPVKRLEAVEAAVRELVDQLSDQLRQREAAAQRVEVELTRFDAEPVHLHITLSRPSRTAKHLWSLLRPQVEKTNLGHGVERISMVAPQVQTLPHRQGDCLHTNETVDFDGAMGQLIDVLSSRLDPRRVVHIEPTETHVPERVYRHRSAAPVPGSTSGSSKSLTNTSRASIVEEDRPSVLFDPPQPAEVIAATPDGPPVCLRWHRCEHRIVTSIGPQRIAGEWWRQQERHGGTRRGGQVSEATAGAGRLRHEGETRDYFKVSDEQGLWLWIFRDHGSGHWFVHGQWA